MPKEPKWYGPYFRGSEEEAREMLLSSSRLLNVETSYWYTSKGYYFEPTEGETYGISYDYFEVEEGKLVPIATDFNKYDGYNSNLINKTFRYTHMENANGRLYLRPSVFYPSVIYERAHTHPNNSEPGSNDLLISRLIGIRCVVFGWNGVVHKYGGFGYWK